MARILIVDDDPVIIKLYQIILKKEGFDIEIARTGAALLNAVAKQKPDVILLDVILPDDNGLNLCSELKKNKEYAGIKIILVSGMEISPSQVAEGIDTGADDYLIKPFDPRELMARIKNCLKLKAVEEELRDKNKELIDLSIHLQHVREEERKALAREVQEELGQLAAALKMDVDWLAVNLTDVPELQKKRMAHVSATARLIIQTLRKIASDLRPSMLDELGLNAALGWQCKEFTALNGVACTYIPTDEDEGFSVELKTAFFRICQESLRNIVSHAAATQVKVSVDANDKEIRLCIMDNGKGFDNSKLKNRFGLIGMRERALAIKGHLSIQSRNGEGTTVSVTVAKE